mmetsp:Transcript_24030/g.29080  ORF Transcript_24030/g.29080 Transcript_24030/m.29080 type:complete len:463 (-) Transcript_24030:453-1841(-)|eukprot:CAMPEP_0197855520 /NCGR_PEP_ID=MMETSP1438-20131217/26791_1 /TAXON_ID=1461541 /ORGANISM="Pterosperma sp., Strain CCMP1384" /LENGTH=462 /DNA_ID=CAMNT_0043470663 /DNA_START=190 /DNA_END=1578 /DNA_ORIENTATION=-
MISCQQAPLFTASLSGEATKGTQSKLSQSLRCSAVRGGVLPLRAPSTRFASSKSLGATLRSRPLKISSQATDEPGHTANRRELPDFLKRRSTSSSIVPSTSEAEGETEVAVVSEEFGLKQWLLSLATLSWDTIRAKLQNGGKVLAASALLLSLGLLLPATAQAASSGGRVGGRSFSSPSAVASPGTSSFGNSIGSSSFASPARVHSTTVVHHHHARPAFGFGGFGYGYGYSVMPMGFIGGGGSLLLTMMLFAGIAYFFMSASTSDYETYAESDPEADRISVLRVQVGLLGMARSLQRDLESIASQADTSSQSGLHYILTEACVSLLRHPDYWVYGSAASATERTPEAAEARFGQLSLQERGKFQEETLTNVSGNMATSSTAGKGDAGMNEYIVVTIIAAVSGKERLNSKIQSTEDLRGVLSQIGAFGMNSVQAVEVLWTPQEMDDTLTAEEVMRDYPNLTPL